MRRSYITSQYSLVQVSRSVGTTGIPEDAKALFAYRKRGDTSDDPWLDRLFPGVTPKLSAWNSITTDKKQMDIDGNPIVDTAISPHNGRWYALERAEEEKLYDLVQCEEACGYITIQELMLQQKRMTFVFNRKYTMCYFVEIFYDEQDANSYCMKSKVYGSRDRALFDFQHGRISWMEFLPLSSLSLVLPRRG